MSMWWTIVYLCIGLFFAEGGFYQMRKNPGKYAEFNVLSYAAILFGWPIMLLAIMPWNR